MSDYDNDAIDGTQPVEQKSRWEDCIDVFVAPTALFERRRNDRIGPPFIILIVLATVFYYVLLPAQGIIMRSALPPETLAKMGNAVKYMAIGGGIVIPIMTAIAVVITAVILWCLARLVDAKPDFSQMMLVAIYAGYIGLLAQIAAGVLAMVHGEEGLNPLKHLSLGALRFVDPKSVPKALLALLARVDIFKIWQAVIWAIGFRVVTGVSKQKAAIVAAGTWFLFAVPGMLGSGIASKMGNVDIKTGD